MPEPVYRRDIISDLRGIRQVADQAWIAARNRPGMKSIGGLLRTLAGGSITAENTAEVPVVSMGAFSRNDGVEMTGLAVRRSGGQDAFIAGHDAQDQFTMAMQDHNQQVVFSAAVDGLGRPHLPVTFHRTSTTMWVSVTSATPQSEWSARIYRQHAYLRVGFAYSVAAGTSLAVELYDEDNAAVLGSTTVAGAATGIEEMVVALPGAHMARRNIAVRASRPSGAGSVQVQIYSAYSVPDPA